MKTRNVIVSITDESGNELSRGMVQIPDNCVIASVAFRAPGHDVKPSTTIDFRIPAFQEKN